MAEKTFVNSVIVALRIVPQTGRSGGAVIPEPVMIETDGTGVMMPGDWSQVGVLADYSGGVCYRTSFMLDKKDIRDRMILNLGSVVATAEVRLNGKKAGVRVAPPWKIDISDCVKTGGNKLEVLVYNTLANHYQTIPSRYRGSPVSGLMGPVTIEF